MPVRSTVLLVATCAAVSVVLLALAPLGAAQTTPVPQPTSASPGVSVVGQGIVLAQPDTARVTLGVEVTDAVLANAQADAARRMDAVLTHLRANGISDADIHTTAYSVNPQYDNNQALRGFAVQNLVDVRMTNVSALGGVLDGAIGAGATRVYGIRFEASNMQDLKSQARDQAMQNARAKADQLARDAGVGIGRPLSIEESDASGVTPLRAAVPAAVAQAAPQTPVQPGELQVQTTVHVVWAIQ